MKYLSLFSGIEAASAAWIPLGWECVGVAEIEKFPSAVLAHHYPNITNFGDITKITEEQIKAIGRINLIVGGFPCQDLSVAGKRKGLKNEDGSNTRSGLFYVAMQIVRWARVHCGLRWLLVENVPGLFSSSGGSDFACVLGEMVGAQFDPPEGKWKEVGMALGPDGLAEWCVLDAQWFGVAQRRKRVFALCDFSVANSGIESRSGPILFEPESLRGNPPPSREARKGIAPTLAARTKGGGGLGTDFDCDGGCIPIQEPGKRTGRSTDDCGCGLGIASEGDPMFTLQAGAVHGVAHALSGFAKYTEALPTLRASGGDQGGGSEALVSGVAHTLKGEGFDASEDGTGRGIPLIPAISPTITSNYGKQPDSSDTSKGPMLVPVKWPAEVAPTLNASFGDKQGLEDQHALAGGGSLSLAKCITAKSQRNDAETETLIPMRQGGFFDEEPIAFNHNAQAAQLPSAGRDTSLNDGLTCSQQAAVAFQEAQTGVREYPEAGTLRANGPGHDPVGTRIRQGMSVRRLTPIECEKLQGFPVNYTNIPWRNKPESPDGPRYKALGNSMAVPCMRWIGERIAACHPTLENLDD